MSALQMTTTVLATGLAEAVAKDEAEAKDVTIKDRGFDLSAGMFGTHVSAWLREVAGSVQPQPPLEMVLYCPACGTQHIDAPKPCTVHESCASSGLCYAAVHGKRDMCDAWLNEPHRSHQCQNCKFEWRPADVATTGVAAIKTRGANDGPPSSIRCLATPVVFVADPPARADETGVMLTSYWQRGFDGKDGPAIEDYQNVYAYQKARDGWLNGREAAGRRWAGGYIGSPAEEGKLSAWAAVGRSHKPFNEGK